MKAKKITYATDHKKKKHKVSKVTQRSKVLVRTKERRIVSQPLGQHNDTTLEKINVYKLGPK